MHVVSYDKQTISNPNPLARFAHKARYAQSVRLIDQVTPKGGALLDFGAGLGGTLDAVARQRPDIRRNAVEPFMPFKSEGSTLYADLADAPSRSMDVITSFEVIEHMQEIDILKFVRDAAAACKTNGIVVISVPIMIGVAIPMKMLNHAVLYRRAPEYSLPEITRAMFGISPTRPANVAHSHKGFDFRRVPTFFSSHFEVGKQFSGPLMGMPWWLNSQAYFYFRPV